MKNNHLPVIKKKRFKKVLIALILLSAVVLGGGFVGYRTWYSQNLKAVSSSDTAETVFTVESGTSVKNIARSLKQQKLIRSEWAFSEYVRSNGFTNSLKAGAYKLKPSQDVASIVKALKDGKVAVDLFTIFPAKRLDQIKQSLIEKGKFSAEEVDKALEPTQYSGHEALSDKPKSATLEGYLYPDSYQITANSSPKDIIKLALDQMAIALSSEVRSGIKNQGLTVHEGVILASIVEKEIPANPNTVTEDRQKAAQVFLKRKSIGMMLGSDVTACYGAIMAGAMKAGDNCDDFVYYQSAYNTRIVTGMPPGPISNVSKSSLMAIANPAKTDFLFFVAGADCITRFSSTNAEHEALVSKHGLSTQSQGCN